MPESWIEGSIGREVEPRPTFEGELAGDLVAAWRGDAPAVPVTSGRRQPRRFGAWWLVAAAALVVAVVVVVSTRVRSTPRPTGPTPTTLVTPPSVTAAPSTTAPGGPTTVVTVPVTTVTTVPATVSPTIAGTVVPSPTIAPDPNHPDGFDPGCVESVSATAGGAGTLDEASLARFGLLGLSPMLTISLPVAWSDGQPLPPAVQATRIPGGTLIAVQSSDFSFTASMLAVVNDDGTTRWVRCFADRAGEVVAAPATGNPQTALVQFGSDPGSGGLSTGAWRVLDLADGTIRADLADVLTAAGMDPTPFDNYRLPLAVDEDEVVLGPTEDTVVDVDRDRLLRFDLRTLTPTLVPFPAAAAGQGMFALSFGYNADGALALLQSPAGNAPVLAALVDGVWSTAADDLLAYDGIRADYPLDGGFGAVLEGRDGHGDVVWRNDQLTVGDPGEGFRGAVDGDVSVVAACLGTYDQLTGCPEQGIAGVRNADGAVLWRLPERRGVVAVGDGHALIVGPAVAQPDGTTVVAGYSMIDTTTGQDIPGQRWTDSATFQIECCGGDAAVTRSGAILAAINDGTVTLWFPASVTPAGARTTLP